MIRFLDGERKTVVRIKHGELELEIILRRNGERLPMRLSPLGKFNFKVLEPRLSVSNACG